MTRVAVYNQAGEKVSETELNPAIFGLEKLDPYLVHFAVRAQRNNSRAAIAHTKNRGEVSGSGKKPWKQKGTGRARAGSVRSPLWRGGGVTFGPTSNRNFSIKLNQSAFRKALYTVLSDKIRENKLVIIDDISANKTKDLSAKLSTIASKAGLGKKQVLVLGSHNKDLERAGRNLPNAKVLMAGSLNIFDLLKYDPIVTKDALEVIEKTYGTVR
ncbi:MAG: 50S ribosomal protein L4 [Candidatus Doudnabacteria bacterium]|nr:50S ribosomal protein L4 [Candidatus Doudnabacteria bacterium]